MFQALAMPPALDAAFFRSRTHLGRERLGIPQEENVAGERVVPLHCLACCYNNLMRNKAGYAPQDSGVI